MLYIDRLVRSLVWLITIANPQKTFHAWCPFFAGECDETQFSVSIQRKNSSI